MRPALAIARSEPKSLLRSLQRTQEHVHANFGQHLHVPREHSQGKTRSVLAKVRAAVQVSLRQRHMA
jgi:hypothetical protein